jgi:hypothetical protein
MNQERFDDLTRALATTQLSRWQVLKAVGAGALLGFFGMVSPRWTPVAEAKKVRCDLLAYRACVHEAEQTAFDVFDFCMDQAGTFCALNPRNPACEEVGGQTYRELDCRAGYDFHRTHLLSRCEKERDKPCAKGTSCADVGDPAGFGLCCSEGEVGCGGTCCPSGQSCCNGTCCSSGQECCNGSCKDTKGNDPQNCGGCGSVCPSGECESGVCTDPGCDPPCGQCERCEAVTDPEGGTNFECVPIPEAQPCGEACCGSCQKCVDGQCRNCNPACETCEGGVCTPIPGAVPCGDGCCAGSCVTCDGGQCRSCDDNPPNCETCQGGSCVQKQCPGNKVLDPSGQTCNCVCPEGWETCGPSDVCCDNANCQWCQSTSGGYMCKGCPANTTCCDGNCHHLPSDQLHCGGCGSNCFEECGSQSAVRCCDGICVITATTCAEGRVC